MSSSSSILQNLTEVSLPLERIYLDPNNPRFVTEDSIIVPDSEIADPLLQDNTLERMYHEFNVEKLRMNMEENGYLPIDRVVVRRFDEDKYVVLEGNRRISAAKILKDHISQGVNYPDHVVKSIREIPSLLYTGDAEDAAWIFQGLRHISGITEWSSYNKARLLATLLEEQDLSLTEVGRVFGLSSHGAGQWVRGYWAFRQAKDTTDFTQEIDERAYPYFQEVFNRSSIAVREWLEWDDQEREFKQTLNLDEFLSWLYPKEFIEDGRDKSDVRGDWEKRAIGRVDGIRKVAYLIRHAWDEFEDFREYQDLDAAYGQAQFKAAEKAQQKDAVDAVFESLKECIDKLENIPWKIFNQPQLRSKFEHELRQLQDVIRPLDDELNS